MPSTELHNFLIPCGTSQIDPEKLRDLQLSISDTDLQEFEKDVQYFGESSECFEKKHQRVANAIVERLVENKRLLDERTNVVTPFGAEISTLNELSHLPGWREWERTSDTYTIFSSDTGPGYFCAQILRRLLIHLDIYAIPGKNVGRVVKVERLKDQLNSAEIANSAMIELSRQIRSHLRYINSGPRNGRDVFVMSGGYKSIIPCLTMFSLIYGIELVYLFERSPFAQSIYPKPAQNPNEYKEWARVWNVLINRLGQDDLLRAILSASLGLPEETH